MTKKTTPPDEPSNVVQMPDRRRGKWSAERKAKWLASIKANPKNHKPASGGEAHGPVSYPEASGIPASGGGWGGPAKGPGVPLTSETASQVGSLPKRSKEERLQQIEETLDFYNNIRKDESKPLGLRIMAGEKLINNVVGTPVARQINADAQGDEEWVVERRIIDKSPKVDKKSG